jgi:amino acid transporter
MSEQSIDPNVTAERSAQEALDKLGYKQELRRSLGLWDLVVYGLVFMVPTAPWSIFGIVFGKSNGMVPLVYIIGLVAMVFTALSYRAMSRAFPVAGSVYSYAGLGIGKPAGFIAGWAILLDYLLIPTLLYVTGAVALQALVPSIPQWIWVVAFVLFNTAVNLAGIHVTAVVNRVFLLGELIVLALFVVIAVVAISSGKDGAHWSIDPLYNPSQFSTSLMFGALSIAVLSFLGFDAISTMSEEVEGEGKLIGRATVLSLCLIAVLFVVQTYLAALLLPGKTGFDDEAAANTAFYDLNERIAGHWMFIVITLTTVLAIVANAIVAQAATSRLLYSMARDRALPRFLGHINPRRKVPDRAVLLIGALSMFLGLVFVGQVAFLSTLVNFGALTAFLLLHVTVVVYYLIKRREKTYGMHLVVPVIGFVIIGYVLLNADTKAKVGGLIWLGIGIVLLLIRQAMGRETKINLDEAEEGSTPATR